MKWRLPSLSALKTFEAAERHTSFTKAAVELCLTQSAVSRQIRMMEEYLGVELFQRVNQRLIVTEAGRIYAADVRRVLSELQDSTVRLLAHQEQGGLLHLATPTVFGVKWLIPRLHSFYKKHFFRPGGARPPIEVIRRFIDEHRDAYGVEPLCKVLQIAPSGYRRYAAQQRNPELLCARAKRDAVLMPEIHRVWERNMRVYGADKVWRQLHREEHAVARCTVERLMLTCPGTSYQ